MDQSSTQQLKKMLETPQGKTFSMAGLTIVVVVLLVFFAIRPAYVSITEKISENDLKREYIAKAETKINTLISLNTVYEKNVLGIDRLQSDLLPDDVNEAFITKNFTELATSRELNLTSFRIDRPGPIIDPEFLDDTSNISQSQFTISVIGELDDIESFVTTLERYPRIVNIDSVNYSRTEENLEQNVWTLAIKGFFYTWSDE